MTKVNRHRTYGVTPEWRIIANGATRTKLMLHLNSYEDRVKQHSRLNQGYLLAMQENRNVGLGPLPSGPEYGEEQPAVTRRVMEAWNWLRQAASGVGSNTCYATRLDIVALL